MSRERTNVIGIVALTICVTAAALVGGWLAASRYLGLGQQTVTAAHEDAAGGAGATQEDGACTAQRRRPCRSAGWHAEGCWIVRRSSRSEKGHGRA